MEQRLSPTKFCIETLLPQGLCILAGAPKIGKSWLVLDLCVKVANGEPFLGQPTIRISAKALKQQMNRYRYKMEERKIFFRSYRSGGQRMIDIHYCPADEINSDDGEIAKPEHDAKDASDARNTVPV